jgi:predicted DNA-binding protein YlxM (UPF0122 family)
MLTDEQVAAIRDWRAKVEALPTAREIAERFGISKQAVWAIAAGYVYKTPAGDETR